MATVAAHKVAQNKDVFTEIKIASRTESKCKALADILNQKYGTAVTTARVDADNVDELVALLRDYKPELVMNLALPYQDLTIMEACLQAGCNYLDTANYEPEFPSAEAYKDAVLPHHDDQPHFEYSWQWAYRERFEKAGLTSSLGCGFDPGVTSVYTAYAAKHHFDEMHYLDIVDCNAGNHHKAFATNFNPEINLREITQEGLYWEDGKYIVTEPMAIHKPLNYPTLKRARFWMTFGEAYLKHLEVIQNLGMDRVDEVEYVAPDENGVMHKVKIVPLQFLKAVLPNPQDLGQNYDGETSIGCRIRGIRDGEEHTYYVYNNCSHQAAFEETGMQGVSYTTGVPAMIGAKLFMKGIWKKAGVHNVEEFDPDPFMQELNEQGLPWHEIHDGDLEL